MMTWARCMVLRARGGVVGGFRGCRRNGTAEHEVTGAEDDNWCRTAYPARAQGQFYKRRPTVDPQSTSVLLFPGQGSQYVGMSKRLPRAGIVADMFAIASRTLGYDLRALCDSGPADQLNSTRYSQPAILLCSLGAVECLREVQPTAVESCVATAGYSLGELTALCFAGALSLEDAVRVARVRGEAMQLACDLTGSGMMTVLFGADSRLTEACTQARLWCSQSLGVQEPVCNTASYLFPHCKVLAGHDQALQHVSDHAVHFRLRRCHRLNVSGAFHTKLMEPAVEPLQEVLSRVNFQEPLVPVYSNLDARAYNKVSRFPSQLVRQLTRPVRWEQTLHALYERPRETAQPNTYECGPGNALTTILHRVNTRAAHQCKTVL